MLLALLYGIERQLRRPRFQTGDRLLLAALKRLCRSRMTIARFRASAQNANDPPLELIGVGGLAGVHHVDNEPPDHDADPCRTPPVGLGANLGTAADEKEIKEPAEDAVEESQEHDLASSRARSLAPSAADRTFRTPQTSRPVLNGLHHVYERAA